jgi:predicted ABC-type ATPase
MPEPTKRMRIFAGPNGSGKSTLHRNFPSGLSTPIFINADEIEKSLALKGFINLNDLNLHCTSRSFIKYSEKSTLKQKSEKEGYKIDIQLKNNVLVNIPKETHSYEAAFVAGYLRKELIREGNSFSFESVLSHKSKLEEITEANKAGFQTYLYFICTETPQINIERVFNRVELGGHPVSKDKIESRYYNSLDLLYDTIKLVHRAYIFDNSGKSYKIIAQFYKGIHSQFYGKTFPKWFQNYVVQKIEV